MTYVVVGNHTVDGVAPGGTVDIADPVRARHLARGGHIRPRPAKTDDEPKKSRDGGRAKTAKSRGGN